MKILIADHSVYNGSYKVGGQHLAENFAKLGHDVLYLSGMLNVFSFRHLFKKTSFSFNAKRMLRYWIKNGISINDNLKTYTPLTLLPFSKKVPFGTSDFVLNNTYSFTIPNLFKYLKKERFFRPDILIVTPTPFALLLEKINAKIKILRITDNTVAFRDVSRKTVKLINRAIKESDFVVATSLILKKKIEQQKKENVFYLSNGVNFNFFQQADRNLPKEYKNVEGKKVVYIGAIDYWFDVELLSFLAKKLDGVNFFLVGSPRINLNQIKDLPNIHILGRKSFEELPKYLWNADVGIIPFKREPVVETVSPIKLYEYMACGLPVISIEWEELKVIKTPVLLAKNKNEFLSLLVEVLKRPQEKTKFIKFAQENSWDDRIKTLFKYLNIPLS